MGLIERGFNGKIKSYGIADSSYKYLPIKYLENDSSYYIDKINGFVDNKTVKIVPYKWRDGCWSETPLVNWIMFNYKQLGYEEIVLEKTPDYYRLKEKMGFNKFPDLLVYFNDCWHRIEVECWGHKYNYCHGDGYADLVYAYDDYYWKNYSDAPIHTLKDYFGVEEIISSGEFLEFLYHYDEEFKHDYDHACTKAFASKIGIKDLPI